MVMFLCPESLTGCNHRYPKSVYLSSGCGNLGGAFGPMDAAVGFAGQKAVRTARHCLFYPSEGSALHTGAG